MPDHSNNSNSEASTPFPAGNGCPGWKFLYHSLYRCLVRDKENIVIETGSNGGFSTIAMAQAIRDSGASGHIYSWEISDDNRCRAQRNISQADLAALVTLCDGPASRGLAERIHDLPAPVCFALLDGSHRQADVLREFTVIHPHLTENSVVVFDNTNPIQNGHDVGLKINSALRVIRRNYDGNLVNLPNSSWWTPGNPVWKAPAVREWDEAS